MFEAPHDPDARLGQRGHMSAYASPFGKPEGLAARLAEHVRILGTDKSKPWVGMGLIADLQCAAAVLSGEKPSLPMTEARAELFAQLAQTPRPTNDPAPANIDAVEDWERALPAPAGEYDL